MMELTGRLVQFLLWKPVESRVSSLNLMYSSLLGLQDRSEAGNSLPPGSELYPHHLDPPKQV